MLDEIQLSSNWPCYCQSFFFSFQIRANENLMGFTTRDNVQNLSSTKHLHPLGMMPSKLQQPTEKNYFFQARPQMLYFMAKPGQAVQGVYIIR
jgi:hypothetical protein